MAEEQVSEEQEAPLGLSFAFLCIIDSMVLFTTVTISRRGCSDCKQRPPMLVLMVAILATLLLFLGISISVSAFCRRRKSSLTRGVVISSIPSEDLEKSPVSALLHYHVPHRQQAVVVKTSTTDLPNYFTAAHNTGEFYSSLQAAAPLENNFEIQLPCYEEAVAMAEDERLQASLSVTDEFVQNPYLLMLLML